MNPTNTQPGIWFLNDGVWLQDGQSFKPESVDTPLGLPLSYGAWRCAACKVGKSNLYPSEFGFCVECGTGKPSAHSRLLNWLPPHNSVNDRSFVFDQNAWQTELTPQEIPPSGKLVFGVGAGPFSNTTLLGFDLLGVLWVMAEGKWHPLTSESEAHLSQMNDFFSTQFYAPVSFGNGWVLPANTGPCFLTINRTNGKYRLRSWSESSASPKDKLHAPGSPAKLGLWVFSPMVSEGSLVLAACLAPKANFEAADLVWKDLPVTCTAAFYAQNLSQLFYATPIVDQQRQRIIWPGKTHALILTFAGDVQAKVVPYPVNTEACLNIGSPYFSRQTGWWQLCFNGDNYGYLLLGAAADRGMHWHTVDSPRIGIGRFTYMGRSYSMKEPWLDEHFHTPDRDEAAIYLPLMSKQNAEDGVLYLAVFYDGSLSDFFNNQNKQHFCELRVTGRRAPIATVLIREPWLIQTWLEQTDDDDTASRAVLSVYHFDFDNIRRFGPP